MVEGENQLTKVVLWPPSLQMCYRMYVTILARVHTHMHTHTPYIYIIINILSQFIFEKEQIVLSPTEVDGSPHIWEAT